MVYRETLCVPPVWEVKPDSSFLLLHRPDVSIEYTIDVRISQRVRAFQAALNCVSDTRSRS